MQQFIMLVGIAGSGKSTYAQELKNNNPEFIILSSDDIRQEIYGDASIQDNPGKVFSIMNRRTFDALKDGKSVVYDATNLSSKRRKEMVDKIKQLGIDCHCDCHIMPTEPDVCIERQQKRDRKVPEEVIQKQYQYFRNDPVTWDEGWNLIYYAY